MLFLWLLGLFLIFPFVELALLLWMAAHVGWLPTLALVVVTAIVGAAEVRREGFRVWIRFNEQLARGELPTDAMFDGLLVLVAGVLLLTPGLITDVIGFALLFPPTRHLIKQALRRYLQQRFVFTTVGTRRSGSAWWFY
ncbi:FxsA family protein, partial [Thermogutta sp.]|uniref:FxsA family protein n=1 Tax=Thermogutta sp. TaxID=1962930 RepID=UPI0032207CA0